MSLVMPREDVEVMRAHGWHTVDKNLPMYFVHAFSADEQVPPNPHNGVTTLNLKVDYVARLVLIQNVVMPRTWRLEIQKASNQGVSDMKTLAYYPDPVTCSVELKLLGEGDIGKGIEELVRDKFSANKS